MSTFDIHPITAFEDNYIWLFRRPEDTATAVVDPGDAQAVLDVLSQSQLQLTDILLTHKHADHIGGVAALVTATGAKVHAPEITSVRADRRYKDMDNFTLFGHQWLVREIPGHTLEHIMYYCPQAALAFVGDTLFSGGCGRIFEGTPKQMYQSLSTIMALPEHTAIYPAHEYTLANLRFALRYDSDNQALRTRYEQVTELRQHNQPSLPTTIVIEKSTNPFCRARELRQRVEQQSGTTMPEDWQVFAFLRHAKDIT